MTTNTNINSNTSAGVQTNTKLETFPELTVVHLYPHEMDINGDYGNLLTLLKRMQWRGIPVKRVRHNIGDEFPQDADIIFGGGGEITDKSDVHCDILRIKDQLRFVVEQGAATLVFGGSYQLFGSGIKLENSEELEGLGLFDMHTVIEGERFIGNVAAKSDRFGTIVGFENHAGKTYLKERFKPLAQVTKGLGNNGSDSGEGVHYRHAIGSYLYGPLLPKNPAIADYLIHKALEHHLGRRVAADELALLTEVDACAVKAAEIALSRL